MKELVILGSTGSIGTQSLEVAKKLGIRVTGLTAGKNAKLLEKQAREFKPLYVALSDENMARDLKIRLKDTDIKVLSGEDGICDIAQSTGDTVLSAIVGIAGLKPTVSAINAGKTIALANKETMVTGGVIVNRLAKENGVKILPVDSEHSAIFQSLQGTPKGSLKKILLTASGGPFLGKTKDELESVTAKQALKHPNWSMGAKITVDSATLMNKGLEVIEAKWLFGVDEKDINVLIHPQSIVHSGVEFMDNSILCQMGVPDMRIPISLALGYPSRLESEDEELDLFSTPLTFEKPDLDTFKCLKLAYYAIDKGGSYPIVMNAANEVLVDKFLNKEIEFLDIQNILEDVLEKHNPKYDLTLEDILEIDKDTRGKLR